MTFDVNSFMNAQFEGENDTKLIPCPIGEYQATLKDVKLVEWSKQDGSASGLKFQARAEITDPNVTKVTLRDPTNVRYEFMLDLTPEGGLDMGRGKNVRLGQLREAVGLNSKGQSFSFPMIEGRMVKVKVTQRPDPNDSSIVYDQIGKVTAVS